MNYITAEEFLKQPEKVQNAFMKWWKPSFGDLFIHNIKEILNNIKYIECCSNTGIIEATKLYVKAYDGVMYEGCTIPLFTEGQLRQFIEDKTDKSLLLKIDIWKYRTDVVEISLNVKSKDIFLKVYGDLLQAYWQVACKLAGEE